MKGIGVKDLRRNTTWVFLSYMGRLGSQAAYFVVLARLLRATGFGAFAAALALVSILAPFAGWGSANLLVMHTARDPAQFKEQLGGAIGTIAISGSACLAIAAVASLEFPVDGSSTQLVLMLAAAELIFARIVELAAAAFQAHDRLRATAIIVMMDSGLRLMAVVFFALVGTSRSAAGWSAWYLGASVVAALGSMCGVVKQLGRPHLPSLKKTWFAREGFFFSLGIASKSVYSDIDKVMLSRLASSTATGIYAAAYRVLTIAFAPIQALVFASNTHLFREGAKGPRYVLGFVARALPGIVGYGIAAGGAVYIGAFALPVVLGPSFAQAPQALRWLALMPLIQGIHYVFGDALMGAGHQAARSTAQAGTAVLNVALNLALIPSLSWKGAAIASLLAEGCLALILVSSLLFFAKQQHATPAEGLIADAGVPDASQ